ncbi:TraB/GumN family protein [Chitinophaga flava]|uniref:TraB/GumN family protein n=1 Tax=Chitinophaga flava TaxID=2259036 RepID=A0A365XPP8_9BACT|nr:TraB/GumN family protein [Chitinophaga flava]RBL88322.1 hypothetical protein DF182_17150 [Chitinophaga flava]
MNNLLKKITLATAAIFTFTASYAAIASEPTEKTVLWEISGNGLNKPSYLFGTFHMLCKDDFIIREKVKKAFDKTTQLVIESNVFDPAELKVAQEGFTSDVAQSARLTKEQYALVDSVVRRKLNFSLKQLDHFRLSGILSFLAQQGFECANPQSFEATLYKEAQEKKMGFAVLETMKEQVDYANKGFSDTYFFKYLNTLDSLKANTARMASDYNREDLQAIFAQMDDPEMIHWVLTTRNINWANKMPDMMKEKSCFFAVGAGHLGGESGMINLLRAKGYKVKPIMK